jgi:uncharacterized membrane protein (DUF485 family)
MPAAQSGKDRAMGYKMRLGVWMFALFAALFLGFVAINIIKPVLMETPVFFGVNLASAYGFGLIIVALILALVYNRRCARLERRMNSDEEGRGE